MKYFLTLTLILFSSLAWAHKYLVLPEDKYKGALVHCSRGEQKASGSWGILEKDVLAIEDDFHKLDEYSKDLEVNFSDYYRQYVGIVVDGTKYIYVNAFDVEFLLMFPENFRMCDAGYGAFGVLYNPETREFSEFELDSPF